MKGKEEKEDRNEGKKDQIKGKEDKTKEKEEKYYHLPMHFIPISSP